MATHPKGTRARVLLSSVFKPFAVDDEFGSREINPIELYHNQVTREQGPFSLRMFHRTWGLMFLQHNVSAPCTVLDFPTRERFVREITTQQYDIIGISAIVVNVGKVREMCRLAREHSPSSTIVVGGHVAAIDNLDELVDADHIVRGEGVRWLRSFLGEDPDLPIRHPVIPSSFGFRTLGLNTEGGRSATIVPSVGCPMGCNFCTTSAFFGGKGKFTTFYESGEELYNVMCEAERTLKVSSFFMMDENFLLYKKRALELLECMKRGGKVWSMYVFSSANAIRKYQISQLVELGVDWIWLGLESSASAYEKLNGADTLALTRDLQSHGICVLGSSIIGLEHHTPENIHLDIDRAVAHDAVFHQFMLYTPMPGTPLHETVASEGRLLRRCGHRRHPRAVQVQLRPSGDLARRVEGVPRPCLRARLRAERAEPVPAHAHDAGPVPEVRRVSRRARTGAHRGRRGEAARRLRGLALGHGELPAAHEPRRLGADSRGAARDRARAGRMVRHRQPHARTVPAVDVSP